MPSVFTLSGPRLGSYPKSRYPALPKTDAGFCNRSKYRGHAITGRIRDKLGLTSRMPKDFSGTFKVDGRRVVVVKSASRPGVKTAKTRIFVANDQGKLIPSGRIQQTSCRGIKDWY